MSTLPPRDPNPYELSILTKLASHSKEADVLSEQVKVCKVAEYQTQYLFLKLVFSNDSEMPVCTSQSFGPTVECYAIDQDGIEINIIIHFKKGMINLLEFLKPDGSEILKYPLPGDLVCFSF